MTLTVLTDDEVNQICESLNIDELEDFRLVLASALHDFSTDAQASALYQQPHRLTTFHPATELTSLYMPSTTPQGIGCKVVSLTASKPKNPDLPSISPTGIVNLFNPSGEPTGLIHATTLTAFRTALASNCLVTRRNNLRVITVFGTGLQAYWHVRLALKTRGSSIKTVYIVNHQFSDSARRMVRRFAAIPYEVKEHEGWANTKFDLLTKAYTEYERLLKDQIRSSDVIFCCTPSRVDLFDASYLTNPGGRKKGRLIVAVGSYTPEMRELPEGLLLQATKSHDRTKRHFHKHAEEGGVIVVDTLDGVMKEAGEIIAAKIGPNSLVELGELVMLRRLAIEESASESDISSLATADSERPSLDLSSAGTSMSTVFGPHHNRSSSHHRRTDSGGSHSRSSSPSSFHLPFRKSSSKHSTNSSQTSDSEKKQEDSLSRWLRDGTVVYKSVGLGLMDLVVGMRIVEAAREKKLGTQIEGF